MCSILRDFVCARKTSGSMATQTPPPPEVNAVDSVDTEMVTAEPVDVDEPKISDAGSDSSDDDTSTEGSISDTSSDSEFERELQILHELETKPAKVNPVKSKHEMKVILCVTVTLVCLIRNCIPIRLMFRLKLQVLLKPQ